MLPIAALGMVLRVHVVELLLGYGDFDRRGGPADRGHAPAVPDRPRGAQRHRGPRPRVLRPRGHDARRWSPRSSRSRSTRSSRSRSSARSGCRRSGSRSRSRPGPRRSPSSCGSSAGSPPSTSRASPPWLSGASSRAPSRGAVALVAPQRAHPPDAWRRRRARGSAAKAPAPPRSRARDARRWRGLHRGRRGPADPRAADDRRDRGRLSSGVVARS